MSHPAIFRAGANGRVRDARRARLNSTTREKGQNMDPVDEGQGDGKIPDAKGAPVARPHASESFRDGLAEYLVRTYAVG